MKEKILRLIKKYEVELANIRADLPEEVREGRHPIDKPYDEDTAMLAGAEDQLQMVITDLKSLIENE